MKKLSALISVEAAKEIINTSIELLASGSCDLKDAGGFVLAEDIYSQIDLPPFIQSSMDGYAIRFSDKDHPLQIEGMMAAGSGKQFLLEKGKAARIFTGAPLPEGADTVVMQERTALQNTMLVVKDEQLKEGSHVRPKGADIQKGAMAMRKGTLLTPAAIGFIAGIGETRLKVYPAPSVAIIMTGRELQSPGSDLAFGQIYESNSYTLITALKKTGITQIEVTIADDDPDVLFKILDEALSRYDMVLLTGGVSVGEYDFVIEAASRCEVETLFHGVAQRPGKPLFFGTKKGKPVFGLPGNPSSVLSCFYNYALPGIEKMMGKPSSIRVEKAELGKSVISPPGLKQFLKGSFENGRAIPLNAQESFQMSSFAVANCLIVLDADRVSYDEGESVDIMILP